MYGDLIDLDNGSVSRAVFDSPEVYRTEQRRVFGSSWLFLTHTSQLEGTGDFVTAYMGEDPVIVTRHTDGAIRAFLNVCRHRGMRVCRADEGNTKRFTCSYHGWSYDTAGALTEVPLQATFTDRFDRTRLGLVAVPKVDVHKGLVFGSWNLDAPPLEDYLGDALTFVDPMLDPLGTGSEMVGPMKWRLRGNWKLAAEQFCGDNYHVQSAHVSGFTALTEGRPALQSIGDLSSSMARARTLLTEHGHANGYAPLRIALQFPEELAPYVTEARDPVCTEHDGTVMHSSVGTVFPNFSHLGVGRGFRVWHPRGPAAMEIWSWVLVGADWPQEVKRQVVRFALLSFSTTGIFETDDSENWAEIAAVGGVMTAEVPFDYQMRHDPLQSPDRLFPSLRGRSAAALSDEPALNFYRRWAQLMDGPDPTLPTIANQPARSCTM